MNSSQYRLISRLARVTLGLTLIAFGLCTSIRAQNGTAPTIDVTQRLAGFDAFMEKTLKDWNAPGIGVGIIVSDKLVFAKGYGYRDYEKKLPITANTMFPIASNTKLFTAVAAGFLVEEGRLTWDQPIRESVPTVNFYNNYLNNTITLRDMLSHRTGITRHDSIWYKSDYSTKELFERLRYLEPKEQPRQLFLYNNMMYAGVGYSIQLQSGKTWGQFVREKILQPLEMNHTVYSISDMLKQPDYGVPFTEKRDSMELYKIPYYEDTDALADCFDEQRPVQRQAGAAVESSAGDARTGDRFAECGRPGAWLVGSFEPGLRDGPLDCFVSGSSDRFPRRRPARLSLADFIHAERAHRRHRVCDRQSHRSPLQSDQLQRVRASVGDGADAVDRSPARHPIEEQESRHGGAQQGRLWPHHEYHAVACARGLCRRVRAPCVRHVENRYEG